MKDLGHVVGVRLWEVGIREVLDGKVELNSVELIRRDYSANGGWETFLSYRDVKT